MPNGGPDGGDGGKGGDVIFEVDDGLNTLADYRHRRKYVAKDGEQGGKRRCHGKNAPDIILKVPEGTIIKEAESDKVIADMSGENRRQVILRGGKGGLGNQHFATATMQVPKYAQPGQPAQELWVNLELKVIADVGLIGFPNVGKSTFLSRVTNANPKIANYHFTTLNPNLGVVDFKDGGDGFVIADIPGLIEGASQGVGLGYEFLRHIERTKMMIHVVDAASSEGRDPIEDIYKINAELENYNSEIAKRPQVIAANKTDLIYAEDEDPVEKIRAEFEPKGIKVFPISGVSGEGVQELLYYVREQLKTLDVPPVIFEQEYFPGGGINYDRSSLYGRERRRCICCGRAKDREDAWLHQSGFRERFCFLPAVLKRIPVFFSSLKMQASKKETLCGCMVCSLTITNRKEFLTEKQRWIKDDNKTESIFKESCYDDGSNFPDW